MRLRAYVTVQLLLASAREEAFGEHFGKMYEKK